MPNWQPHWPSRCSPSGPVIPGSGRPIPTPVAMLQIDFIHSVSAIGMWMIRKELEIGTLVDFLCC